MIYDAIDIEVEVIKAEIMAMRLHDEWKLSIGDSGIYGEHSYAPLIERLNALLEKRKASERAKD